MDGMVHEYTPIDLRPFIGDITPPYNWIRGPPYTKKSSRGVWINAWVVGHFASGGFMEDFLYHEVPKRQTYGYILLMVQKSHSQPLLGWCKKNLLNDGIIHISTGERRISEPSTNVWNWLAVTSKTGMKLMNLENWGGLVIQVRWKLNRFFVEQFSPRNFGEMIPTIWRSFA